MKLFILITHLILINTSLVLADEWNTQDVQKGEALKRKKSLNFEERRVEAATRPLDSFQHVAEKKNERNSRLYDVPKTFQPKNQMLIKSIGSN